ncbi:hypothetical protein RI367_006313 [Sorochytrium milnesiophthora]
MSSPVLSPTSAAAAVPAPESPSAPTPATASAAPARDARSLLDSLNKESDTTSDTTGQSSSSSSSGGGGWGWASWGASIVSTAIKAVEQVDVTTIRSTAEKLGQSVTKATSGGLDKVYETLDPEYVKDKDKIRAVDEQTTGETPADEGSGLEHIKQGATVASEAVFSTLDYASDFLGNAVLSGYRAVSAESAKISDKVEELKNDAKTRQVVESSGVLAKDVASHSLEALEQLGRKAMGVINETALNLLSSESEQKFEQTKKTISGASNAAADKALSAGVSAIDSQFEMEELLETLEEEGESDCLQDDSEVAQLVEELKSMELSKHTATALFKQMKQLVSALRDELAQKPEGADPEGKAEGEDSDRWKAVQENMFDTAQKTLSDLAEVACELLLRVSEVYLLRVAEEGDEDEGDGAGNKSPEELATSLRTVVHALLKELNYVGAACVASLAEQKDGMAARDGADDAALSADLKRSELRIFEDVALSLSYVQEAAVANRAILRLLLAKTVAREHKIVSATSEDATASSTDAVDASNDGLGNDDGKKKA